jgi:hypothetical protein
LVKSGSEDVVEATPEIVDALVAIFGERMRAMCKKCDPDYIRPDLGKTVINRLVSLGVNRDTIREAVHELARQGELLHITKKPKARR